jgi:hypothetical protein
MEALSMRVALFFDGKNFYRALSDTHPGIEINYDTLAAWVVERVAGAAGEFQGACYYTGHNETPGTVGRSFTSSLTNLNLRTGFFVRREPRVKRQGKCRHCGKGWGYWTEKRVDTRLVADMIHYAAVDAYDVAVLFSGDQDLVPAVEAAERLGRRVYVATWSGRGLSRELRARCFGEVDLADGLATFQTGRVRGAGVPVALPLLPATLLPVAVEVAAAQGKLRYVSRWYFENRWIGTVLPPMGSPERVAAVEDSLRSHEIEEYDHTDARGIITRALRVLHAQ